MKERWNAVKEFPSYSVSNLGRIRRTIAAPLAKNGFRPPGFLKPNIVQGYRYIQLWNHGSFSTLKVATLVAQAFLGPRPSTYQINHIDGNKSNDRMTNLEYVTRSENQRHAYRLGLHRPVRGECNGNSKLTSKQVARIRRLYQPYRVSATMLAKRFGVSHYQIWNILMRHQWKHLA